MIAVHYIKGQQKYMIEDDFDVTYKQVRGFLLAENEKKKKKVTQLDNSMINARGFLKKYSESDHKKDLTQSYLWKLKGDQGENRMSESFISNASNISQSKKINLKRIAKLEN